MGGRYGDLGKFLPKAQLLSLISDPLGLPGLVIEVNDEVFHKLSFCFGSEPLNNVSVILPLYELLIK